jgi:glycine C-acetyltransferase/8-amino-7-oxononanoate synthase
MITPDLNAPQSLAKIGALNKSVAHFARLSGSNLLTRTESFLRWQDMRRAAEVWPYSRGITGLAGACAGVRAENGRTTEGANFASTDYLALTSHPAIHEAAIAAIRTYGTHSPSSPMLQGNTDLSLELEAELGALVGMEHVVLFSTGWAAGFGSISGLVRPNDHIVMDNLAHACLQQGAQAATANVHRHEHLNVDAVRELLHGIRMNDARNGILVISEGLFSMDSDYPDLARLQAVCREYEATLLVDVAHDLGAMGPGGTGQIGQQNLLGQIDLVMGAFSKTFATNGGFLATNSRAVKHYVKTFGGPHIFSTAMSPVQAAAALEAVRIVRSAEGDQLRADLALAVDILREQLALCGIACMGEPTAIVPVAIGSEKVARLASAALFDRHVFANLVEFPAVAVGAARFRMQVMATHTREQLRQGARAVHEAIHQANCLLRSDDENYAVVQGA